MPAPIAPRALVAVLLLLAACAPPPVDEEEQGCEVGEVSVTIVGLDDGDALVAVDDDAGGFSTTLDIVVDGVPEDAELRSLRPSILGVPRPPVDAAPGDDGQGCIVQGGAYLCANGLRCVDQVCRVVIADRNIAPLAPVCSDDHTLHLDGVELHLTELMTAAELDGYEVELRVAVERAADQYDTAALDLVLALE